MYKQYKNFQCVRNGYVTWPIDHFYFQTGKRKVCAVHVNKLLNTMPNIHGANGTQWHGYSYTHKAHIWIYITVHSVCPLGGIWTPPPPSPASEWECGGVPIPTTRERAYHSVNYDDWRKSLALCQFRRLEKELALFQFRRLEKELCTLSIPTTGERA